jgi:hypothetical protein
MLAEKNPQVGKAVAKLMVLSEDEQARMIAESRVKMRRDIDARYRFQVREAKEEGREDLAKAMMEGARGMFGAGDSVRKISEIIDLSPLSKSKNFSSTDRAGYSRQIANENQTNPTVIL